MNECFYPTCKLVGRWGVYVGDSEFPKVHACIEHLSHAIAVDQCSASPTLIYTIRKLVISSTPGSEKNELKSPHFTSSSVRGCDCGWCTRHAEELGVKNETRI